MLATWHLPVVLGAVCCVAVQDATKGIKDTLDAKCEAADLEKVCSLQSHLALQQRQRLHDLLKKCEDLFNATLGKWKHDPMDIKLKADAKPCHAQPHPITKMSQRHSPDGSGAAPWILCMSVVCDSALTGLSEGQTTHSRHQSLMAAAAYDKTPTLMRWNTQLTSGSRTRNCFCKNTAHSSAQEATSSRLLPSQFSFSFILI